MAKSESHRWGQIIGVIFEEFVRGMLGEVTSRHRLYLDSKGTRPARGRRSKVTWRDAFGNGHDLDFVIERGGTADKLGEPVAFVESAWRRYTKHSKNKVQEIEAAVVPVAMTFASVQPFRGAVLAGEFTASAIRQLESKGFAVLHIPYLSVINAFARIGIDAGSLDGDGTSEEEFLNKIEKWNKSAGAAAQQRLFAALQSLHTQEIAAFKRKLEASLLRTVASVRLTVLRGHSVECSTIDDAVAYLVDERGMLVLREDGEERELFEVTVRLSNGARCEATFPTKEEAIIFLRGFAS